MVPSCGLAAGVVAPADLPDAVREANYLVGFIGPLSAGSGLLVGPEARSRSSEDADSFVKGDHPGPSPSSETYCHPLR